MGTVINTPQGIAFAQLCAQTAALRLEIRGLKRRGRSVYSLVKQQYKLRGSREKVLEQLEELKAKSMAQAEAQTTPAVYSVLVGNVGNISVDGETAGNQCFEAYVTLSKSGTTRAAGESVYLLKNGSPIREYHGPADLLMPKLSR